MSGLVERLCGIAHRERKRNLDAGRAEHSGAAKLADEVVAEITRLRAEVATLEAARWVKVEDCPEEWKDGRAVLLHHAGWVGEGYWATGNWYPANDGPDIHGCPPLLGVTEVRPMPAPPEVTP